MSPPAPVPLEDLLHFLESTKVVDVASPHKEVVELKADMTTLQAAKILNSHHIIGAPVWDDATSKYCGFFDMRDLLSTVVASHKAEQEAKTKHKNNKHDWTYTKWFLKDNVYADSSASTGTSNTISYLARRDPFVSLGQDATLKQVFQMCATRCHRVPIVDPTTGRCVRIVSQSAMVKCMTHHLLSSNTIGGGDYDANDKQKKSPALKAFFGQTLAESTFPYKKKIVSVTDHATANETFALMDARRISGLAVVDSDDGVLVGNTSATDIKLAMAIDDDNYESPVVADLELNIMTYLSAVRQMAPPTETRHPICKVQESSSTLGHVIKLLAKTGYHRVFVVDTEGKPVGVVSVTDIVIYIIGLCETKE